MQHGRTSRFGLKPHREQVRAAEHAPRGPFRVLVVVTARSYSSGGNVQVKRLRVIPPHLESEIVSFSRTRRATGIILRRTDLASSRLLLEKGIRIIRAARMVS